MSEYTFKNTTASVNFVQKTQRRNNSFNWGLLGYRLEASVFVEQIRSKLPLNIQPFTKIGTVNDETRWLALYCTTSYYTLNVLICKTGLRRNTVEAFCAHYGIDFKTRTFFGGAK